MKFSVQKLELFHSWYNLKNDTDKIQWTLKTLKSVTLQSPSNPCDLWPESESIHLKSWASLCAECRCRLRTAAWGKEISEWCLAGRSCRISPTEERLWAEPYITDEKNTPHIGHIRHAYLLLVQQPAVRLQAAVHRWRVDLSFALRRLHCAGHSLQHIHGRGAQDPGHVVVQPCRQCRVQDGDLLLGQRCHLLLQTRRRWGARWPETYLLHHLHQLVLHILQGGQREARGIRQEQGEDVCAKIREGKPSPYLYCNESCSIEKVCPAVGHLSSRSLTLGVFPPDTVKDEKRGHKNEDNHIY